MSINDSLAVAATAVKDTVLTVADSSAVHGAATAMPRRDAPSAQAAVPAAATGVHPGLSDETLVILLAAAASEQMGQAGTVVKFRPMDSMDWTWSVQGRVVLHNSHKLS